MLKYLPNMPARHVGIALNAHGPNNTLVLGDVSGPAAMIEAATCIQRGIAKVMLGLARGKRQVDKRQTTKDRDWNRQKARVMRERG